MRVFHVRPSLAWPWALAFALSACVSGTVRSTGAVLPQNAPEFHDENLTVRVDHDCSDGVCTGFEATFENRSDVPVEILPRDSRIGTSAQRFALMRKDDEKTRLVVPPRKKVSEDFVPVSKTGAPLVYPMPQSVWCSLKVDPKCKDPQRGEALCSGFARYYYQTFVATEGWVTVEFRYRAGSQTGTVGQAKPDFLNAPPPVTLTADENAPSFGSSSGPSVFHKVECNERCACVELTKRRNFTIDNRFEPAGKR